MQLKTDKCNFIHLGRCVKSGALNIPHDSPWLIFPWSETPIISHEPNSTRMARRSPRGQFSGHLPLTHHSCEGERRGQSCQEGPEACTYGGGEGRRGRGWGKSGQEEEDGEGWWSGDGDPWSEVGGGGEGVGEEITTEILEGKQGRQRENPSCSWTFPRDAPSWNGWGSGVGSRPDITRFLFPSLLMSPFPFAPFKLMRKEMPKSP